MNHKSLIILLCLVAGNLNARQVITGKLTDKETVKPVEAASVELLQLPDSIMVEAITTNSEGSFIFYKGDTAKSYCLRIKHVSYKTVILHVAKKTGSMINNVGAIVLEPAVVGIKEIVVGGSKILVTELPDRTVYAIPEGIKKTSTDGLDVLRKIPSVQVDYLNENITVEGKTNIKIEVDGVTRDKDYVKRLRPAQVDKVEINTNPSGKYDADVDAVINYITNKEMRYGLKGNVIAMALPNSENAYQGVLNFNIDYGLKKISYYIAETAVGYNILNTTDMQRNANNNLLHQAGEQPIKGYYENINGGFIYDPDELNNLNLNMSYNRNKNGGDGSVFNYLSKNDSINRIYKINSIYKTITNSNTHGGGLNTSLFYKHKFDKIGRHNIEFETNYYNSLNNIGNITDYQNVNYSLDTLEVSRDQAKTEESNTNKQTISARTSYFLPFDSVYTFGTGINANYNQYKIDNISSLLNTPNLNYKDMREMFFSELSRMFKKGNIKVGTRVEHSGVTINSTNKNSYFSWLPYANGQYKINSKNSIKLSYSRRVIRPSSDDLNPFISTVDSQTVSHGNINLKPAYRDNIQLSYNLSYGKGKFTGTLSPQLFYEYRTGLIQKVTRIIENTNVAEKVPQNISNGYETGAGISVSSQIAMVMVNSYFRYTYNHIDKYLDQINETNKRGWNWNINLMSPLPYKMNFFSVLYMSGPTINGQEETKTYPFYLIGLVKQFKNNSNLRLMVFNPFANKKFNYTTTTIRSENIYQTTDSYLNLKNAIVLVYIYNFNIGKAVNLQKRNSEQDNEDNANKVPFKL